MFKMWGSFSDSSSDKSKPFPATSTPPLIHQQQSLKVKGVEERLSLWISVNG